MLSGVPGILNPAHAMLRVVRQSRDDLTTSQTLLEKSETLFSSIRPSTIVPSMHERLRMTLQVGELRERTNLHSQLVDVIVQLHGDSPIYGTIRRNNTEINSTLNRIESTSENCRDKINHSAQLSFLHRELSLIQTLPIDAIGEFNL